MTALSLYASWRLGSRRRGAWLLNAAVLLLWSAYFARTRQYGLLLGDLVGIAISLRNYLRWASAPGVEEWQRSDPAPPR